MQAEQQPLLPNTDSRKQLLEEQVAHYQDRLTDQALDWLDRRGLGVRVAESFRLGSVIDPAPEHVRQEGWLAIPYLTTGGVSSLRFRCLEDHSCRDHGHGKYKGQKGDVLRVFNARAVPGADAIHLTEGEVDCMTLAQMGYTAIGLPGASSWRPHHAAMLAGAERIYVWADPDDPGQDLAEQILSAMPRARLVPLGRFNLDVNDLYVQEGPAGIWEALEGAWA